MKNTSSQEKIKVKVKAFFFLTFGFILILSTTSLLKPAQSQLSVAEKPVLTKELFLRGEKLYQKQCAVCHGVYGAGDGTAAYLLYPKPRDFTRNEFRLISTTEMQATDEDLFKTITRGMPGSAMPSWDFLSENDQWGLVYYVRYLNRVAQKLKRDEVTQEMIDKGLPWDIRKELATEGIDPAAVMKVSKEPPVTEESLSRGRELFVKACAACHGLEGRGDGKQLMTDNLGFPIRPRDLTAGIFKGAASSEELYFRIGAGLPGSPMPGYKEALTEEQIWDLIHYVQMLPQKGAEERARLRRNKILARRTSSNLDQNPLADQWLKIEPVFVSLTPLWWRNDRVEGVEIRALHDGKEIAIHLAWLDATENDSTIAPQSFSDGAALQLSGEQDPPLFAMGSSQSAVTIWHWKASWQEDTKEWADVHSRYPNIAIDYYDSQKNYEYGAAFEARESKTPFHDSQFMTGWGAGNPLSNLNRPTAEEAQAKGLGTLTTISPKMERVEATGMWKDGKWHLLFRRALRPEEKERLGFKAGETMNIAFAIWDGEKKDRNGQKMVSIWNELTLEK